MLHGRKILIGVTAGIAAYKISFLIRLLIKEGAEVRVVMTPSAKDFVTPLTLATLSKNPVVSDYFDKNDGAWSNHVELGNWPDIFVIAPLTANTLSKMANGQSDNLLLATYLSAKCDVFFAPAMDLDMYQHSTTKKNLKSLAEFGDTLIPPGTGELASGLEGEGRMAEPEEIVKVIGDYFNQPGELNGKKVLITAGPTYESLDPVRFIGNRSSGKMGYELAKEAVKRGATVTLVSGPSKEQVPKGLNFISVESTADMYAACMEHQNFDFAILAAAVSDYRAKDVATQKIKKSDAEFSLQLQKTEDILLQLGNNKKKNQVLIGFALESENEIENALKKLNKKNLDYIILNSIRDEGATFGSDKNKITIIDSNNNQTSFKLKDKSMVAKDIFDLICGHE